MLQRLRDLFSTPAAPRHRRDELQLAAAALLVEAAVLDGAMTPGERRAILAALERRFALSHDEAAELLSDAESASAESTQLFKFTRVIGRSFAHEERIELVEMICEVIYADGELHAHEDSLLRRIGELIYLPDRDRGAARQRVKRRLGLAG
ncbi:MAG TPA: TerB family tellurite resistance protein [Alphaproteobacteria bacterium]|nr:TerB family tellurite resistance protein [Alphaproteobacteria bacterium]